MAHARFNQAREGCVFKNPINFINVLDEISLRNRDSCLFRDSVGMDLIYDFMDNIPVGTADYVSMVF